MIRISFQLMVGVLLSGCTVNTYHSNNYAPTYHTEVSQQDLTFVPREDMGRASTPSAQVQITGNLRIKAECEVYEPLPVPRPARIDLEELQAAKTSKEVNAIALQNVKELHQQLTLYAQRSKAHYAEYVKRCVVK